MKKVLFIIVVLVLVVIVAILMFDKPTVRYNPSEEPPVTTENVKAEDTSEEIKKVETKKVEPLPKVILPPQPTVPKISETKKTKKAPVFINTFINSDKVRLRKAPKLDAEILNTLEIGSPVKVLQYNISGPKVEGYKNKGWCKIEYLVQPGYVYGAFVSSMPSDKLLIKPPFVPVKKDVFVRKGASFSYTPIVRLPEKTKVVILGRTRDRVLLSNYGFDYWFKIDHGKAEGWVFGSFLEISSSGKTGIKIL